MNVLQKATIYLKTSAKAIIKRPSLKNLNDIIMFFPAWWKHLKKGRDSVSDNLPWLSFGAINFIRKIIRPDMMVFEYGSGGSTLFWLRHVKKIISIEHDKNWYERMAAQFKKKGLFNVEYVLSEAENDIHEQHKDFGNPNNYKSADPQFEEKNFEAYVKQIDRFPDYYFDVVVVDGRARPSCIMHSLSKVKENGYLIIDNTERKYYLASFSFDQSLWKKYRFYGPFPYSYHFSETTILQRRKI